MIEEAEPKKGEENKKETEKEVKESSEKEEKATKTKVPPVDIEAEPQLKNNEEAL